MPPPPALPPAKFELSSPTQRVPDAEIPAPTDGRHEAGEGLPDQAAQGGGECATVGEDPPPLLGNDVAGAGTTSFRNADSMTTLQLGATQEFETFETVTEEQLDVPLAQFLNKMSDTMNQQYDDDVICGDITLWFERRNELSDIALLDPPMEMFADKLENAFQRTHERTSLRDNLLNSHIVAKKKKFETAANTMLEKQRVNLKKQHPTADVDTSEAFQAHVKRIEEWKQEKIASMDLEVMSFDDETNLLTAALKSIYAEIVEKVCQLNREAAGKNHDDVDVDMDLMKELELLFEADDSADAKVSWHEITECKLCISYHLIKQLRV